eukprot:45681-Rhodomonas_salina.1
MLEVDRPARSESPQHQQHQHPTQRAQEQPEVGREEEEERRMQVRSSASQPLLKQLSPPSVLSSSLTKTPAMLVMKALE